MKDKTTETEQQKTSSRFSSFKLGGKYCPLIPDEMEQSGETYRKTFGTVIAELKIRYYSPSLYETVTMLCNCGTERTEQITDFFGADMLIQKENFEGDVIWESINGDCNNADSFLPRREAIESGHSKVMEAVRGRPSMYGSFPFFEVHGNNENGCSFLFALGWSGQWKYSLSVDGNNVRLTAGLSDCDFYLEPGESVRSVSMFVCTGMGVTSTRQAFRRLFREKIGPFAGRKSKQELPLAMQCFDLYNWTRPSWRTEEEQLQCIDAAKKIGYYNTYWLDAAWFDKGFPKGVGNYSYTEGLKNGLKKLSERAHGYGMKFLLWFEPERVFTDTETYNEHGEYLLSCEAFKDEHLLNLSDDKATDWLIEKISGIIAENGIDIYRQDFNHCTLDYWRKHDEATPERKGMTEIKYITNLYRFWDTLRLRFPELLIDNCSSGGTRLDIELLRRSVPLWRSDVSCGKATPERPVYVFNQNQTLGLSRYLPYHCASTWATDAYTVRSASTMGLATAFDVLSETFDFDKPKAALKEFTRLRRYWDGDFWPLTDASKGMDCWSAFQLSFGTNEGMCEFYRRAENNEEYKLFRLNAIDENSDYDVVFTDEDYRMTSSVISGKALKNGIKITLAKPESSIVVEYKKKK